MTPRCRVSCAGRGNLPAAPESWPGTRTAGVGLPWIGADFGPPSLSPRERMRGHESWTRSPHSVQQPDVRAADQRPPAHSAFRPITGAIDKHELNGGPGMAARREAGSRETGSRSTAESPSRSECPRKVASGPMSDEDRTKGSTQTRSGTPSSWRSQRLASRRPRPRTSGPVRSSTTEFLRPIDAGFAMGLPARSVVPTLKPPGFRSGRPRCKPNLRGLSVGSRLA